jgi:sulfur carrier protein ThiS
VTYVRLEVRLYATLAGHLPGTGPGDLVVRELPAESLLVDLLQELKIPEDAVHLAIVDGRMIHDRTVRLRDGARIALFPPIGGG